MSSVLFLIAFVTLPLMVICKQKDIYHVITGESDIPYRKSLDPVYYVGVYEEKPIKIPSTVKIYIYLYYPCTYS